MYVCKLYAVFLYIYLWSYEKGNDICKTRIEYKKVNSGITDRQENGGLKTQSKSSLQNMSDLHF